MNVFDLFAKISLDTSEYENKLNSAESKSNSVGAAIGTGLKTAAVAVGTAAVTAGGAIANLTKSAVENYGEYEQLVGGVSTLFGTNGKTLEEYAKSVGQTVEQAKSKYNELTGAEDTVMAHAQEAWKTKQMSANDYLSTVTEFSASLIQSMSGDTTAAAEKADMAISDMADNANKMGSTTQSVQDAYRGFSKQNYTMLDNLKLGYGGTKAEMERLLEDAEKLSGVKYDISSYADIVDAIHVVQENMGVMGTSTTEAQTTIQGSAAMMKAAWENLKTAFADSDADLGQSIDNLTSSVGAFVSNVSPKIEEALPRIGEAIGKIGETILPLLSQSLENLAPGLGAGIVALVGAVLSSLPDVIGAAIDLTSTLLPGLEASLGEVLTSLGESLPGLIEEAVDLGQLLVDTFTSATDYLSENFGTIMETLSTTLFTLIGGLFSEENVSSILESLANLWSSVVEWVTNPENIDAMLTGIVLLLDSIVQGVIDAWPGIKETLTTTFVTVWDNFGTITTEVWDAIKATLSEAWENIKATASEKWEGLKTTISSKWESIKTSASQAVENIKTTVSGAWDSIKSTALAKWSEIKQTIESTVNGIVQGALTWGKDMIDNFVSGIKSAWNTLTSTVSEVAASVKRFLGFSEPEEGPLSNFHTYAPDMMDLFAKGVKDNEGKVISNVENVANKIKNALSGDYETPNITSKIKNTFSGDYETPNITANPVSSSDTPVNGSNGSINSSVNVVNNFTINGENASEISDTVAEKIQEALENLQIRREIAFGR